MKPSEIIKLARRQTWCTEDIVTKEEAYHFLNFVIEDFGADIRTSDSGYWFDVVNAELNVGESLDIDAETWVISNKFPLSKIQSVWMLDNKTNKWRDLPVHFVDKMNPNDFESNWEPRVCFITNTTLNLVPQQKETTNLMIWGFVYNPNLWYNEELGTRDDDEEDIFIPKRWHYILIEGMKYWLYGNMWSNFEAQRTASRQFYDSEKDKAIQGITDRWQLADMTSYPEENYDKMEWPNLDYLIY